MQIDAIIREHASFASIPVSAFQSYYDEHFAEDADAQLHTSCVALALAYEKGDLSMSELISAMAIVIRGDA